MKTKRYIWNPSGNKNKAREVIVLHWLENGAIAHMDYPEIKTNNVIFFIPLQDIEISWY